MEVGSCLPASTQNAIFRWQGDHDEHVAHLQPQANCTDLPIGCNLRDLEIDHQHVKNLMMQKREDFVEKEKKRAISN